MTKLRISHKNFRLRDWLLAPLVFVALILLAPTPGSAQTVNVDRVVAELEPEIQRALLAGNIPSASVALISGDQVIWSNGYGYSNLWARTPAAANTVLPHSYWAIAIANWLRHYD